MSRLISLIVSVCNEEEGLKQFYDTTKSILKALPHGCGYEICFVNDGSTDGSSRILSDIYDNDKRHVRVVTFSKNFGHEAAMTAGLDYASGDCLIFMDADLQHPPELIPAIIAKFDDGYDIVSMVRTKNESAGSVKNITSELFYRLMNRISESTLVPGASDFFALNKAAADVLRSNYREKVRFLRGYVQNIGFRRTVIEYEAGTRVAGHSHYSLRKLWRLSVDTIVCFSNVPLKLGVYAGLFSAFLGVVLIIYTLITKSGAPSGYATIVILLCFMFAVMFILLGIIGEYIAIIFREIKDRPIYIVQNIDMPENGAANKGGE